MPHFVKIVASRMDQDSGFRSPVIATASLDRILHHSTTINIKGNFYRLREKIKAGLIREPEVEKS
jgi:DNA replication protein DnaC